MITRHFTAAKGVIRYNGKILIVREGANYKDGVNIGGYDVIGGRIDSGETLVDGLKREVFEESGLTLASYTPFFVDEIRIQKHGEEWYIIRIYFACESTDDTVKISDDHDDYKWIDAKEYAPFVIANLKDMFEAYLTKASN